MRGRADSGAEASVTPVPVMLTLALLLAPLPPSAAPVPEGCSDAEPDTYTCRWVSTGAPAGRYETWEMPMFEGPALATFTVVILQGPDSGWLLRVERRGAEGGWEAVSESRHMASPNAAIRHQGQSTHVLVGAAGDAFRVWFHPGFVGAPGSAAAGQGAGTFEVSYLASRLPPGDPPSRPAATSEDPHIEDIPSEAAYPSWDLRAAWFNDERLDDHLFDAHLRVHDLLNMSAADFQPPSASLAVASTPGETNLTWKLSWIVEERAYYVEWSVDRAAVGGDWSGLRCELRREALADGEVEEVLAHPICAVDLGNATFHATIPEAAIGSPPEGEIFDGLVARTRVRYAGGFTDVVDDTPGGVRYHFALGGPAVWSALNPRLDPPPIPWYADPLAPENIADTVQLGGALAAATTFVVGLVLVARRRRETARLLAKVDEVEESGIDSADVLLRLGALEQDFNRLFRRHRISDAQYQVLSQRIAGVATRFALRRSLGLDDGTPGEAPVASEEGARRVPVRDGGVRPRR